MYLLWRNGKGSRVRLFKEMLGARFRTPKKFFGQPVSCKNREQFFVAFCDVFLEQQNLFPCHKERPVIVDAGANVGLTSLYLKRKFPKGKIIAIEPDPENVAHFKKNVPDVTCIEAALSCDRGFVSFYRDVVTATGGSIQKNQSNHSAITVAAVRLQDVVQEEIDYLKLDVEGMETAVVKDVFANFPHKIWHLFIEFHYNPQMPSNKLSEILQCLEDRGYEYILESRMRSPFRYLETPYGCNIFAYLKR